MRQPTVLMFGWEFPPFNAGGLGVACYGLAKALAQQGVKIIFVLPKKLPCSADFCRIIFADNNERIIKNLYSAYSTFHSEKNKSLSKGWGLLEEVKLYAKIAREIAKKENFDIIHAHDWLSFPAGLAAKEVSGKPLIAHIHATEFDRTGGLNVNSDVFAIEKQGFEMADKVAAVSNFTKEKVEANYGIDKNKIAVIHNAVDHIRDSSGNSSYKWQGGKAKLVLFLGRLTLQKGPDYFLLTAKKVADKNPDVYFAMAGSGDMQRQLINQAIDLGISDKVIFTGFLRGDDLNKIYQMADLYVMPSVSEPFGITALEAADRGTPILISKQSGVSEVIKNCLRVDFWDINQMANKILAVLQYPVLKNTLRENSQQEVAKINWDNSAKICFNLYQELLH